MLFSSLLKTIKYTVLSGDPENCEVDIICQDSRYISKNGLFVCIVGTKSDGHDYAEIAYKNGCRAFIVTRPISLPSDACTVLTGDTRIALASVSAEFYCHPSKQLKVIGITGTKGKTTTALTTFEILNAAKIPTAYIGSNGIKYCGSSFPTANTTPESLDLQRYMHLMVKSGIKYLVMEVSSQAIYMNRIHGMDFETVVFTNLSPDHIGGAEHPTFEHYRDCKKRLFTDFAAKNAIYNLDDPHAEYMVGETMAKKIACSPGGNKNADIYATNAENKRLPGSLSVYFDLVTNQETVRASVPMPGAFSVANALLATAICQSIGLDIQTITDSLKNVRAEGRFEAIPSDIGALFIIDYAHNGASLAAALKTLREFSPKRLICLFGSVGGRTEGRRKELGDVASELADFCIITSDNPDFEPPGKIIDDIALSFKRDGSCPYVTIFDRRDAIKYAISNARDGDIILLAGKGHEKYQLICGKKVPFSERTMVEELLIEFIKI